MKGFLGIDVSKGYADFSFCDDQGKELIDGFQLDDTKRGHAALKQWIKDAIEKYHLTQLDCAVESTGGFEDNWHASLLNWSNDFSIRVSRLNPSVVNNSARAELKANVTDMESAKNIASYIRRFSDQVSYNVKPSHYSSFRTLHNHLTLVTKQRTQLINELKQLLYIAFPELQRFCKQSVPQWVLNLLKKYPSASKLAKVKENKLMEIKSISLNKAKTLIAISQDSIASRQSPTDEFVIKMMVKEIDLKQQTIKELKEYLSAECTGLEATLIQSIKGIGAYSAASIMIQIEDIKRFSSPKELASYFGLHPTVRESGDKQAKSKMSKRGRPAIRATLYMCANSAVLSDPHMKSIYAKHRSKGKSHKQSIGVVMHKMLRIIWGVLNSGIEYQISIDTENQNKNTRKVEDKLNAQTQIKRRIQEFDDAAPISRLASKKRKVRDLSQVGDAEQMRDLKLEPSA